MAGACRGGGEGRGGGGGLFAGPGLAEPALPTQAPWRGEGSGLLGKGGHIGWPSDSRSGQRGSRCGRGVAGDRVRPPKGTRKGVCKS